MRDPGSRIGRPRLQLAACVAHSLPLHNATPKKNQCGNPEGRTSCRRRLGPTRCPGYAGEGYARRRTYPFGEAGPRSLRLPLPPSQPTTPLLQLHFFLFNPNSSHRDRANWTKKDAGFRLAFQKIRSGDFGNRPAITIKRLKSAFSGYK